MDSNNGHNEDISKKVLDSIRELTPRQREFVLAYCDKDSPTYGNKSASYSKAYYNQIEGTYPDTVPRSTIHTYASQLSKINTVNKAIEQVLDSINYGYTVRLSQLSQIGLGQYEHVTTSVQRDKEGNVVYSTTTTSKPKPGDIIKSIDIVNKMTGAYTTAELDSKRTDKRLASIYDRMQKQASRMKDITGTGEGD